MCPAEEERGVDLCNLHLDADDADTQSGQRLLKCCCCCFRRLTVNTLEGSRSFIEAFSTLTFFLGGVGGVLWGGGYCLKKHLRPH